MRPRRFGKAAPAATCPTCGGSGTVPAPSPVTYGAFLWRADKLSTVELLDLVAEIKLTRVMPKVMNKRGHAMYERTLDKHIPALQAAGIEVVPWAYLDDRNGESDARKLVALTRGYGCNGAVANMEREAVDGKTPAGKRHDAEQIDQVLTVLRSELEGFVGFSSFRQRNYFPYPRDVFTKQAAAGVVFMNQCYRERTPAGSRERVRKSIDSWREWKLPVRITMGLFPKRASASMYSLPAGMKAGAEQIRLMAGADDGIDVGFDWWALEQARHGYAPQSYRDVLAEIHAERWTI